MGWRTVWIWAIAVLVACAAAPAGAAAAAPRQTYSERFTTQTPGAPTGRMYAIDWMDPANPEGKPPSFSHLRVELAPGTRFDTSAVPHCLASDLQLILMGAGACPADSVVARDVTVLDTGFPGSMRFLTTDLVFFNNRNELVILATIRENGVRAVLRGRVGVNTIDLDVPPLPGMPPDGAAAKRQRGGFLLRSARRDGAQRAYLTTPPACPASGYWVNKVTYTYRDGVTQTAQSRSPCRRLVADRQRPVIRARGIPRRCVTRDFRARFRIVDASPLRAVQVALDRRVLRSSRRKRLAVRIPARRLRPGRHTLRVAAVDVRGHRAGRRFVFRRCR